ncbi:MAG: hypothetical protein JSS68_19870 [Actinobacteria bacterium]|nr:hypothetical protein [Actinomycetota bacterium]
MRRHPRPALLLVLAALAGGLLASCGGGGEETGTVGGGTVTIPGDAEGVYGELEAILDQYPYQRWYVDCVMREAKKFLDPREAEEMEAMPDAKREQKSQEVAAKAGPACEKSGRPTIDPNASSAEIQLLRVSSAPAIAEFAEGHGMSSIQVACVQSLFKKLSDKQMIELRNGTAKAREGILVSVFKPCSRLK